VTNITLMELFVSFLFSKNFFWKDFERSMMVAVDYCFKDKKMTPSGAVILSIIEKKLRLSKEFVRIVLMTFVKGHRKPTWRQFVPTENTISSNWRPFQTSCKIILTKINSPLLASVHKSSWRDSKNPSECVPKLS